MKKTFLKVVSFAVIASLTFGLAACSKPKEEKSADPQANKTETKKDETKKEDSGKKTTLKLWHMWVSDGDGNKKPFEAVIKHAQEQFKDVTIEVDGIDNESYKTKIKTAVAANQAPDIFFTWAAGFSKPFVDGGKVLALDEYMGDIKDKLLPGITDNMTYNGKVYGLPFQMQVAPLYCNKEIFDQNNVKIPQTYDDLLAAVKTFSAKGITPIICGAKDLWPAMFYYDALALRTAGAKNNIDALSKKASFDSPDYVEAAKKLAELSKEGAFGKSALGLSWDEATVQFAEGKGAMIFNGNWVAGITEGDKSKVKGKVVITNFPTINGAKGKNTEFLGGAGDGFMASANTADKATTAKVLKFLCEDMAKEAYIANAGMPGWKVSVDDSKVSPLVKQMVDMTKSATGWVLWWDVFLEGADADTHKNLVVEVLAGKRTPEDFAKEMQKLNEKK